MKVTIVMCEGPHDSAFMSRIMHADGYHTYNEPLNNYPTFIAEFLKQYVVRGSLDDLNLKEARGGLFLPSFALFKDNRLLLLYQLRGDSKKEGRKMIVSAFDLLFRQSSSIMGNLLKEDDSLSIVFIYDADNKGVGMRITEINKELEEFLNPARAMQVNHASFDAVNGIKYGAFIFHEPDENDGHGRLEDLVLPLMCQNNVDVKTDVDILISKRENRSYSIFAEKSKEKDKDYDLQKATIGIMGQLQKSGSPNSAIIEQSAFIEQSQILGSDACTKIIQFINASFS